MMLWYKMVFIIPKNSRINVFAPLHQLSAHLHWTHGTILQSFNSSPIPFHILKVWTSLRKPLLVQSFSCVQLFATPWSVACQASLSIPSSQILLKLISLESLMPSNHLILFSSCLQFFPASGSFQMSHFFLSGGRSIGASASVLPMNIWDWFPLGLTGLISLQFRELSRVFSNITIQKRQFFGAQLSL